MRKLLLLALLLLPVSAIAQTDDSWRDRPAPRDRDRDRDRYRDRYSYRHNAFELTPIAGYRWGGTLTARDSRLFLFDVDVSDSAAFGAILGIPVGNTGLKLELMANHQSSHLQAGDDLFSPNDNIADIDVNYYHAGLQIPFSVSRNATPYAVISAGLARLDPDVAGTSAENRFSGSAGIGVKVPVTDNLGFRFEARGYFTALDTNDDNDCRRCEESDVFTQGETSVGLVFSF